MVWIATRGLHPPFASTPRRTVGTDGFANRLHPGHIAFRLDPDLHLQRSQALASSPSAASSAARSGSAPETDILIGTLCPNCAAEQPVDRQPAALPENVPERDLDARLRERMPGDRAPHLCRSAARCPVDLRPTSAGSRKLRDHVSRRDLESSPLQTGVQETSPSPTSPSSV